MARTRREFLQTALAGAALAALPLGAARAEGFALNYILASSLYGQLPLKDILPEVSKVGATHIDLWPKKHGSQREELDAIGEEAFLALLAGMVTVSCLAICALRMRVSISAMGSFTTMGEPPSPNYPYQLALRTPGIWPL